MCAKIGRPTDDPKTERINVRVSKNEKSMLLECCKVLNKSQYEVVMDGIKLVKEGIKK